MTTETEMGVDFSVHASLTYSEGEEVEVREITMGMGPAIHIEPIPGEAVDGRGRVTLKVDACDMTGEVVAEVLEIAAEGIRMALAKVHNDKVPVAPEEDPDLGPDDEDLFRDA